MYSTFTVPKSKFQGLPSVKRSDIVYRHMRDPAMLRYYYKVKTVASIESLELAGSSPTDLFIGRFGYPKVSIGPLIPPEFGDTSILATPERWVGSSIEDIVDFRARLVRGMHTSNVHDVENGRVEERVRDLALAEKPTVGELGMKGRPFVKLEMRDEVQPYGPSVEMRSFELDNIKADRKVERLYMDTDAKSTTALTELYHDEVNVSKLQMALSAGLFGVKGNRKFVPTRWSITAVDDTLSKANREEVKGYESVDAVYAYYSVALDNRWIILLIPGSWEYESIEAFFPGTVWNEDGRNVSIFGSYEGWKGRKTYAEMGGCYYSGRLAVTEKLLEMKRQARALILREAHPGYIMPVGVWNVREHVRDTLRREPRVMHSLAEMMVFIAGRMDIRNNDWIANSTLLKKLISQKGLAEYVAQG